MDQVMQQRSSSEEKGGGVCIYRLLRGYCHSLRVCMFCHSSVQQTLSVQSWLSIHTVQRSSMSLQTINKDVLLPKSRMLLLFILKTHSVSMNHTCTCPLTAHWSLWLILFSNVLIDECQVARALACAHLTMKP